MSRATEMLARRLASEFGADFLDLRGKLPTNPSSEYPFPSRTPLSIGWLTVHHTATGPTATWEAVAVSHTRGRRQWPGIGYVLGVRQGQVSLHGDVTEVRWHDSENYPSMGAAVMGNFETAPPAERDVAALRRLVAVLDDWRQRDLGLPLLRLLGHRDVQQTACPGQYLYPLISTLRDAAAPELATILGEAARVNQALYLNPGAALQKQLLADGLVPTSSEFAVAHAGAEYIAQRAESLASGQVYAYYVKRGEWHDVRRIELRSAA